LASCCQSRPIVSLRQSVFALAAPGFAKWLRRAAFARFAKMAQAGALAGIKEDFQASDK
jgi:hypothetical protein